MLHDDAMMRGSEEAEVQDAWLFRFIASSLLRFIVLPLPRFNGSLGLEIY